MRFTGTDDDAPSAPCPDVVQVKMRIAVAVEEITLLFDPFGRIVGTLPGKNAARITINVLVSQLLGPCGAGDSLA